MARKHDEVREVVRARYAELARQASSCCGSAQESDCACYDTAAESASGCCGSAPERVARAEKLYSQEELEALSEEVIQASAGSGNPTALAELRPGEVVLDLGSGGGIDCFLAARQVGPSGRAIGVDMTPEMVHLARENARALGMANVEFRLGEMEHLPVETASVDVIISNCVINLSPDKEAVFREAHRVLKSGGRLCVSDIVCIADIPPEVKESLDAWSRCIAGAEMKDTYLHLIREAGFQAVNILEERPSRKPDSWRSSLRSIGLRATKG